MASQYDFIVVGAGASGAVVAARLAESVAKPSVLLLEAGGPNENVAHLSGVERFEIAFKEGSPLNWGYKTAPQHHGQVIDYSRGKGLGGSTAINFCGWTNCADDDYDEWARRVDDEAFAWKHVKETLRKIERLHNDVPADFKKYIKPKDEDHSMTGKIDLSYQSSWKQALHDIFQAADEVGFGVNNDVNNGNPIGMGMGTACIYEGVRVTSSSAYLSQPPDNLTIMTDAHVEKVVIEDGAAVGVRVVDGRRFTATKEVILSGGALNTPQLLLLSGVGPRDELEKHQIPVIHELVQVGKNLQDHCFAPASIVVEKKSVEEDFRQSPTPMGWFKVPAVYKSEEFRQLPEETQQFLLKPHVPLWEMPALVPFDTSGSELPPNEEILCVTCMMMSAQSSGTVTLQSNQAIDPPIIDPKFITHPFDKRQVIECMREMIRYLTAPVWKQKTVRTSLWPKSDTDEGLLDYFVSNLRSSWHMCGTVRMGKDKETACVDASFKVLGLKNLRVADLSVTPFAPNGHIQSVAYIIGELAAEKLIAEHQLAA